MTDQGCTCDGPGAFSPCAPNASSRDEAVLYPTKGPSSKPFSMLLSLPLCSQLSPPNPPTPFSHQIFVTPTPTPSPSSHHAASYPLERLACRSALSGMRPSSHL